MTKTTFQWKIVYLFHYCLLSKVQETLALGLGLEGRWDCLEYVVGHKGNQTQETGCWVKVA